MTARPNKPGRSEEGKHAKRAKRSDVGRLRTALEDPDAPFPDGVTLGPYCLEQELARGGQGVIVRARHRELGRTLVLKILDPRLENSSLERFRQEGKVLARLKHPNLPTVSDLGEVEGVAYLAMDYVEGEDLEWIVERDGIPEPEWSARVLEPIARALAYCHGQGVVHRDVKPANILIEAETERPVLVDFGLLKRDPEVMNLASLDNIALSRSYEIKGTPEYMPPEQADPDGVFGAVSPASDVHGLGCTLYFLLTGRAPYQGETTYSVLEDVVSRVPPRPKKINPEVPVHLDRLCSRALAKDPLDRPKSAGDVARALRQLFDESGGELVVIGDLPPPPPEPEAGAPPPEPTDDEVALDRSTARRQRMKDVRRDHPKPLRLESNHAVPSLADSHPGFRMRRTIEPWQWAGAVGAGVLTVAGVAGALWDPWAGLVVVLGGAVAVGSLLWIQRAQTRDRAARLGAALRESAHDPPSTDDPSPYTDAGLAKFKKKDYEGAIKDFTAVLKLRPKEHDAWLNRGICRYKLGDTEGAAQDFARASKLCPDDAEAFNNLGLARYKLGEYPAAVEAFSQAVQLDPEDPDALCNRGAAWYRERSYELALADFDACLALSPKHLDGLRRRGRVRARLKDHTGAIEDFGTLLKEQPDPDIYRKRAKSYRKLGRKARAAADEKRAAELE